MNLQVMGSVRSPPGEGGAVLAVVGTSDWSAGDRTVWSGAAAVTTIRAGRRRARPAPGGRDRTAPPGGAASTPGATVDAPAAGAAGRRPAGRRACHLRACPPDVARRARPKPVWSAAPATAGDPYRWPGTAGAPTQPPPAVVVPAQLPADVGAFSGLPPERSLRPLAQRCRLHLR
jgi:hypothetical protein